MKQIITFFPLVTIVLMSLSFLGKAQKITILYDNYLHKTGCTSDWGFSCLIEFKGKTILGETDRGTIVDIGYPERIGSCYWLFTSRT